MTPTISRRCPPAIVMSVPMTSRLPANRVRHNRSLRITAVGAGEEKPEPLLFSSVRIASAAPVLGTAEYTAKHGSHAQHVEEPFGHGQTSDLRGLTRGDNGEVADGSASDAVERLSPLLHVEEELVHDRTGLRRSWP